MLVCALLLSMPHHSYNTTLLAPHTVAVYAIFIVIGMI